MSEPTGARRYGTGGGDAYYDAVKYGGYEGTREQFGKDQAEFAANATAVAEAKAVVEQDTEEVRSTKETFVNTTVPDAIAAVQQEGADQVQAVTQQGEESSQQVEAVGTQWKDEIANEGRARVQAVEQAGTDQVQAVEDAGTAQVGAVNQAGEDQVDAVEQAGADQVQAVTNEGTTQVGNVTDEGDTQVQRVQDKGDEVIDSIPADYTALDQEVDNLNRQLSDVEDTANSAYDDLNGEKNYLTGYRLISEAGATRGQLIKDSAFDTSKPIPISTFGASGQTIVVHFGTIPVDGMFALYDEQDNFIDSWTLPTTNTARDFTFNYASYNPSYVRFCFESGYSNAKIQNTNGSVVFWEPQRLTGLKDEISDFPNTFMQTEEYVDFTMVNRLDPQACELGKYMNAAGQISENSSYNITGYLSISEGETLYLYNGKNTSASPFRFFTAYDKDKNILPTLGSNDQVYSITQTGDMAFVRGTIYASDNIYQLAVLVNQNPPYIPRYGNTPLLKAEYIREKIYVYAADTEAQIIQKFVKAYGQGNCDVIFERADYSFGAALATIKNDYHLNENEIPIGNDCRYFFNGSTLTAVLDLANLPDEQDGTEYYCNFFGCGRLPSSYELYDGVLIATDTRYIIHDEASGYDRTYKHIYQNMEMHYHTNLRTDVYRKCIGGGIGQSGVVDIVGCVFTTDAPENNVTFHEVLDEANNVKFDISVRDSWFSKSFRVSALPENQTGRVLFVGNSVNTAPTIGTGWTSNVFLNEVRT